MAGTPEDIERSPLRRVQPLELPSRLLSDSDLVLGSHHMQEYGRSLNGAPLLAAHPQPENKAEVIVYAGIHGSEADTTFVLSRALREIDPADLRAVVIPCANPDGAASGHRANARGVDLNRNWPVGWMPWSGEKQFARGLMHVNHGEEPLSEPETMALSRLVVETGVYAAVDIHAPLNVVYCRPDDPLGNALSRECRLRMELTPAYKPAGVFREWAWAQGLQYCNLEFPDSSFPQLITQFLGPLKDLLRGQLT